MLTLSEKVFISEETILKRVDEMGAQIAKEMGSNGPIAIIGLLRGCFVFTADLVRAISRHGCRVDEIDFIIASSYESGTVSSGNVKIERDARHDIAGKNVLIVDDILDTGNTLNRIGDLFSNRKPNMLRTCVLLDKPSRREAPVEADYVGISIEDKFVVGYGLDYDQKYRELPYITVMEES